MNAILGFSQLLESDTEEPLTSSQKESVSAILSAGHHLLDLINEVLDLARIESGRLSLSIEPVMLEPLFEEIFGLISPLAEKKNIKIVDLTRGKINISVMADRTRLKQVLLNLLSNAVNYNRESGSVTVSGEKREGGRFRINITDTGCGISKEDRKKLFQPFSRLGADRSEVEGTGIGLAISKKLIELTEEEIGVESELEKGSTFWIEVPLGGEAGETGLTEENMGEGQAAPNELNQSIF